MALLLQLFDDIMERFFVEASHDSFWLVCECQFLGRSLPLTSFFALSVLRRGLISRLFYISFCDEDAFFLLVDDTFIVRWVVSLGGVGVDIINLGVSYVDHKLFVLGIHLQFLINMLDLTIHAVDVLFQFFNLLL